MASGSFRFDRFVLDPAERRLLRDGAPVDINARYLDALTLLVREGGSLIAKDRFLDEVWRGVPVTDEALTQCVRTLRRLLGDDAARPRFIETVPKFGYRFVAPVEPAAAAAPPPPVPPEFVWRRPVRTAVAATIGGGAAGVCGGVIYGFAGAAQPGTGAVSMLLVLLSVNVLLALVGGLGVGIGIAMAEFVSKAAWRWAAVGGAIGGMVVGALVKLLALDAAQLLLGRSPADITGAMEGALLGGAAGLGGWLASRSAATTSRVLAAAATTGTGAGIATTLLGGRLMGGSLDLLAERFPASRFNLDRLAALFGEAGFGPATRMATNVVEALVFTTCVVGAIAIARRRD